MTSLTPGWASTRTATATSAGPSGGTAKAMNQAWLEGGSLPSWAVHAADPGVVFVGGPVQPDAAICLGTVGAERPSGGWDQISGPLGVIDLSISPEELGPGLDRVRVFAGYAGWDAGQLEGELKEGGWYVLDAEPDDALSATPEMFWRFVLRRQGGKLAWVANFPPHASMN